MTTLPIWAFALIIVFAFLLGLELATLLLAPHYITKEMIAQIKDEMKKKGAEAFCVQAITNDTSTNRKVI